MRTSALRYGIAFRGTIPREKRFGSRQNARIMRRRQPRRRTGNDQHSQILAADQNTYRSAAIVSAALRELGYKERENSNYSKYEEWYGCPDAYWCDMFVSWCANEARQCICDGFAGSQESSAELDAIAERIDAALSEQSTVRPDATRVFVRTMNVLVGEEEKSVEYFLHGGGGYVKVRDFVSVNGFDIFWEGSTNTVCIERAPSVQDDGGVA